MPSVGSAVPLAGTFIIPPLYAAVYLPKERPMAVVYSHRREKNTQEFLQGSPLNAPSQHVQGRMDEIMQGNPLSISSHQHHPFFFLSFY